MMKKKLNFMTRISIAVCIGILSLTACSNPRYIHSPTVHNATFFRQQGDFKISVAGAGNPAAMLEKDNSHERSYGFDGQAAVAVTNHFMLTASGMYRTEKDRYGNDDLDNGDVPIKVGYTRNMFEAGAGFFAPLGHKTYFNGVVGVGFGQMESTDRAVTPNPVRDRMFDADLMKYYFHPSFNMFFNDYIRMSVAPRFSLLKLNNIKSTYTEAEETLLGYTDARKHSFGLFEPSVVLQTGFRNNDWLKLDFGFNFSSDPFTTRSIDDEYGPYAKQYNVQSRNFMVSVGLSFYPMGNRNR